MIEIPKKLEEINVGERYFQLIGTDKGSTSYEYFCVAKDTPDTEIFDSACTVWDNHMIRKEERYIPSIFFKPPKWLKNIKVVELQRNVDVINGKINNEWKTLRKGLKFRITLKSLNITLRSSDLTVKYNTNKRYFFDKLLMKSNA